MSRPKIEILLQPKQERVADLLDASPASWLGMGGGRGCAKSYAVDALQLERRFQIPSTVGCIVMRNYDQVRKYHIEPMLRNWPWLEKYLNKTDQNLKFPVGGGKVSQIDFSYAENLADVERRFRSANYYDIMVDQAEQFLEDELREMKKACRWPGVVNKCRMMLSFNMGGAGIQTLRKWFHSHEYNEREDPSNFAFVHVFPWDNVEWSRASLEADGWTGDVEVIEGGQKITYPRWFLHYYRDLTDEQRMEYCATRSDYGKDLNSEDDALRNRDWLGSWESLEGSYFGRAFDRQATLVTSQQVSRLVKAWDTRWMGQDWGKSHYCATYWNAKTVINPDTAASVLGWSVNQPLNAVITYREKVVNELSSPEVAAELIAATPEAERKQIKRFFLSPDAFGSRDSDLTTAINLGKSLKAVGMPDPEPADTDRAGGWTLMYDLLLNTKKKGLGSPDIWLISAECGELLNAIPILMRDPKDLDVVLKTDKSMARIEQDCSESARYSLKSMLAPRATKPREEQAREIFASYADDRTAQAMRMQEFAARQKRIVTRRPRWRR